MPNRIDPETIFDDSRGDDPPSVEPVRRDPSISIQPGPLDGGVTEDGQPRRSPRSERAYQRGRKIGWPIGFALAVATATVLAGAVAHAVWLTIKFGLWQ